jgi:hypothetical protein
VGGSQFFSVQETAASDGTFIVTIHDFPPDLAPGDAIDVTATADGDPAAEVASYRFHMMGPHVQAAGGSGEGYVGYYYKIGETVHLFGDCFLPGASMTIDSSDVRIKPGTGQGVADDQGFVTIAPVIGAILRTGSARLRIREDSAQASARTAVTVALAQLDAGTALALGGELISPSGHYRLVVWDSDIVFVARYATGINSVRRHRVDPGVQVLWQMPRRDTPAAQSPSQVFTWDNGSVVDRLRSGRVLWSSHTGGRGGVGIRMQDDGNLVMRTAARVPIWSTRNGMVRRPTLRNGDSLRPGQALVLGRTQCVLQRDGNLVAYRSGVSRWSTHTAGRGDTRLTMQPTGNLVLSRRDGTTVWSTHTGHSRTRNHLTIRADGDIAMYTPTGRLIWHTNAAP